jgi:uncharacterized membrane protein YphA (DoxX/SURF4 family)
MNVKRIALTDVGGVLTTAATAVVAPGLIPGVVAAGLYVVTTAALGALTLFWYLRGVLYDGREQLAWVAAAPLAPLGTVVGILNPPGEFRVTRKIGEP